MHQHITWLDEPEPHDYPAAASYLSLLYKPTQATMLAEKLKRAPIWQCAAKDIFRASELPLLGISNSHVEKNRHKIVNGHPLSPVLLVRTEARLLIVDGYHRVCAVYGFDEDAFIPCKIVGAQ